MNKSIPEFQADRATDVCSDYSIGQQVFAYLENNLSNENEIAEFVEHAGDCSFCMQTIIKWHYDSVVMEMKNQKAEMSIKPIFPAKYIRKPQWDWPAGQINKIKNRQPELTLTSQDMCFTDLTDEEELFH